MKEKSSQHLVALAPRLQHGEVLATTEALKVFVGAPGILVRGIFVVVVNMDSSMGFT